MIKHAVLAGTLLVFSGQSLAKDFSYPELLVKPSASERLLMEAKAERKRKLLDPLPMQVSATTTLVAGILQYGNSGSHEDDEDNIAAMAGVTVGASWLVLNFMQFNRSKSYRRSYKRVKGMGSKSKKDRLAKERIAEEALADRAELVKRFTWMSAATNFGASFYMYSNTESGSMSKIINAASMAASLLPLIFKSREQRVYETHKSYKKKIYAPLVNLQFFYDEFNKNYNPGLALSYQF